MTVSHTKGRGFESRDEQVLPLGFVHIIGASTSFKSVQEASIEHDYYKLKACFAIDVQ